MNVLTSFLTFQGMMDAVSSTWFGTQSLYVHMINFMPVTAVTGELFSPRYVAEEYSRVLEPLGEVEMAWRGYVVADQAIVDANAAWVNALNLYSRELDSALSKTQVLYWVATRRGFNVSQLTGTSRSSDSSSDQSKSSTKRTSYGIDSLAECNAHPVCIRAGLKGFCCPTSGGVFLDCCNVR
jgi:hypothetical protein